MALAWSNLGPESGATEAADFKSPSLELLHARLQEPGRHHILDLGAPREVNVRYFSEISCRLYIEDLHRTLLTHPDMRERPDDLDLDDLVANCLCDYGETRFDVVYGWDLFNFLDEDAVRALMRRLAPVCRTGTMLFMLVSTRDSIPRTPARFTILDRQHLRYEPDLRDTAANPRYSPRAMERMMPGFKLLHSFLLGDGMQDYLFTFA